MKVVQQEDKLGTQEELLCSLQASNSAMSLEPKPTAPGDSSVDLTVTFSDNLIGWLAARHPVVSNVVDGFAKSNGVKVTYFVADDNCVKVTLSGSQKGITQVKEEILAIDYQLQFDIETKTKELSCMFAPLLTSPIVLSALEEIEDSHHIELSVIEQSNASVSVQEFSSRLNPKDVGKPLCVTDFRQFITSKVSIPLLFDWKVQDKSGKVSSLGTAANQHLNQFWNSSNDIKTTLVVNGVKYIADVSSLKLVNVSTREECALIQEQKQPIWSYCIEANQFIEHEESDSRALEQLYQFGGSSVTLAGSRHTLDLGQMQQIDLNTGEGVTVRRHPPITQGIAPTYDITISVRGLVDGLDAGIKAIQEKLESLITSCTISIDFLTSIPQKWQEIILVQIFNAAREYCVKIGSFGVENGKLEMQLQGAKEVLDKVQVALKEHCLDLQHHVISLIDLAVQKSLQDINDMNTCPQEWEPQNADVQLFSVNDGNSEWTGIAALIKQTIPRVAIFAIQRIQNIKLWDKYALEMKHMSERNSGQVNEKFLFHGTRGTDPHTVIESVKGIDFRYSRRDYQLLWGTGAYFAVNASYSDNYCYVNQTLQMKQLLLVRVLTGKSCGYGYRNDPDLTKPPPLSQGSHELFDTVNGFTNGSYVYVVYDHDRAYPAYLISYIS